MYYVARWYDSGIGHFVQADTVVPGAGNPAAWNRYAYVMYNPIKYVDPSGHWAVGDDIDPPEPVDPGPIGDAIAPELLEFILDGYIPDLSEAYSNKRNLQENFLVTQDDWPKYSLLLDRKLTIAERNFDLLQMGTDILGIFVGGVLGGIAGLTISSPTGPGAAAGGVAGAVAGGIAGYAVGEGIAMNVPGGAFDIYEMEDIIFWLEDEVNSLEDNDYLLVSFEYHSSNNEYTICVNATDCQTTSKFGYEQIIAGFRQAYEELK